LGPAGVGALEGKIARLWLPGLPAAALRKTMAEWVGCPAKLTIYNAGLAERIAAYFDGARVEFADPVELGAITSFQRAVLAGLRENIPRGKTITYSGLAQLCGRPGAARAIGAAMAGNPVPLIIPCHRVIRADGGLGGFSGPGETKLKKLMLELEAGSAI